MSPTLKPSDRTIARYLKEKLDGTVQVANLKNDGTKVWRYDGRLKPIPDEYEIEEFIVRQVSLSDPRTFKSETGNYDSNDDDIIDRALKEIADRGLPDVSRDQILQDLIDNPKAIISKSIHTATSLEEDNERTLSSIWQYVAYFKDSVSQPRFSFSTLVLLIICFRLFEHRKKREGFFFLMILFLFLPQQPNQGGAFSDSRNSSTVQTVRLKCSHQKH